MSHLPKLKSQSRSHYNLSIPEMLVYILGKSTGVPIHKLLGGQLLVGNNLVDIRCFEYFLFKPYILQFTAIIAFYVIQPITK